MGYTEEELLALIERHDEHEDFYRSKLADLRSDYTPTTAMVAESFVYAQLAARGLPTTTLGGESLVQRQGFDRWLTDHDAKAVETERTRIVAWHHMKAEAHSRAAGNFREGTNSRQRYDLLSQSHTKSADSIESGAHLTEGELSHD